MGSEIGVTYLGGEEEARLAGIGALGKKNLEKMWKDAEEKIFGVQTFLQVSAAGSGEDGVEADEEIEVDDGGVGGEDVTDEAEVVIDVVLVHKVAVADWSAMVEPGGAKRPFFDACGKSGVPIEIAVNHGRKKLVWKYDRIRALQWRPTTPGKTQRVGIVQKLKTHFFTMASAGLGSALALHTALTATFWNHIIGIHTSCTGACKDHLPPPFASDPAFKEQFAAVKSIFTKQRGGKFIYMVQNVAG